MSIHGYMFFLIIIQTVKQLLAIILKLMLLEAKVL